MLTKLKRDPSAKTYPIQDLRAAVVRLQAVLDKNYGTLAKAKRESIDAAIIELVESYNGLRSTLAYKPSLSPWIPHPDGESWPVSETDKFKPSSREYAKPLLGPNPRTRRQVK